MFLNRKRVSLALLVGVPLLLLFLYEYVFPSDDAYLFDDFLTHNTVLIVVVLAALMRGLANPNN